MNHWLMKSEPEEFSIGALERAGTEQWDGVRNYQARNFIRRMAVGDLAFFYHSNCPEPGIVGIMRISSEAYPDPTAFDPEDKHYDPKSDPGNPRWFLVDVTFERRLRRLVSLAELKEHAEALSGLPLLRRGNRLSVMPVTKEQWKYILRLEESKIKNQKS